MSLEDDITDAKDRLMSLKSIRHKIEELFKGTVEYDLEYDLKIHSSLSDKSNKIIKGLLKDGAPLKTLILSSLSDRVEVEYKEQKVIFDEYLKTYKAVLDSEY